MKENSIKDRINILKIECYITINDEKEPILNIGTSFSNMIESEEFKDYNDELRKNIKPVRNGGSVVENSIEEDIELLQDETSSLGLFFKCKGSEKYKIALEHILLDYKRVLKENEELKISNKEIEKECSRLEKKEVKLINENEYYKDLIYALKTYYDITEEDLEKCMKNDR